MSFDNNLLTEVKGIEYVVGLGYRFKDVILLRGLLKIRLELLKEI
jgi:hypothetical protein